MPTYVFYPSLAGGTCLTFLTADLADDQTAMAHAGLVLLEHVLAVDVAVWQADRQVGALGLAGSVNAAQPELGWRRVLIVEVSVYQAEDLRFAFRSAGFGEVEVANGEVAALASLERQAPDLVVVDIDLGEGSGLVVAEALEQRGVPFLFHTRYDRAWIPQRWRHVDHVLKPAPSSAVVAAAQALLGADPKADVAARQRAYAH